MTAVRASFSSALGGADGARVEVAAAGDRALLFAARDGQEPACRELLRRHGRRLLQIVRATHPDLSIGEDVVQEAFLRALAQAEQLREEASLFPWLVRIALRVALDHRRRVRRELLQESPAEHLSASGGTPEERYEEAEESAEVRRALASLPAYPRELIVLRYFGCLSSAELAEVFGKSEVAVRKDLQRARDRVRVLLGPWFEEATR